MSIETNLASVMDISTPIVDGMNVHDDLGVSNDIVSSKRQLDVPAESDDKQMHSVVEKASLQESNKKQVADSTKVKFTAKNAIKIQSETCKFV